jgi:methionyl-tRNA formyltransferase
MRLLFLGSPEFAVPCLLALAAEYTVAGVLTQPDRPAGRGKIVRPPPVKDTATALGLPVLQPVNPNSPEVLSQIAGWQPDLLVVAAYGRILRPPLLSLPPRGCLNVHASLLPRWRGASPIQAAILAGDTQTGVTIMLMDAGMDTGPILAQQSQPITDSDTAGTVSVRLAQQGAHLLLAALPEYLSGRLQPRPQDDTQATPARLLSKADGALDLQEPAVALARKVRAFDPWPGTFLTWNGKRIGVLEAAAVEADAGLPPGHISVIPEGPVLTTAQGGLLLQRLQPAGSRPMSGKEFLRGQPAFSGARLLPTSDT